MVRLIISIILSVFVVGCAGDPAKVARADDEACRGYGIKPGTEAYASCRVSKDNMRVTERGAWARHSRDLLLRD